MRVIKTVKEGDEREEFYCRSRFQDPWQIAGDSGTTYIVEPGDCVYLRQVWTKYGWGNIGARLETDEEREARLGPVRWWQWRRKRQRQLPRAVVVP